MKPTEFIEFQSGKQLITGIGPISEFLAEHSVYLEAASAPRALHVYAHDIYIYEEEDGTFLLEIESETYKGTLPELEETLFNWTKDDDEILR